MNIGDKVRLLHSKEEGVITKFLKGDVVEVEIEEGFKLPIARRELVVISKSEEKFFKPTTVNPAEIAPRKETPKAEKGIFLAFISHKSATGETLSPYIINNTDWDLPFSLSLGTEKSHRGLMGGYLKAKSFQKGLVDLAMKEFDEWGVFHFSCFYHTFGFFIEKPVLTKKMRMRANTFFQNKKVAPLLEEEALLFQLDAEEKNFEINAADLKEKMFESKQEPEPLPKFPKPASTIDLHIEKLTLDFMNMNTAEMLDIQLRSFEKHLEKAIAGGLDEVIFIHGVGNGVLRNEIHKRLSQHKNVAYYQDAQKEKFGYGATKAGIK